MTIGGNQVCVLYIWSESPCRIFKNHSNTETEEASEIRSFIILTLPRGWKYGMPPGRHIVGAPSKHDYQAFGEWTVRTSGQMPLLGVMVEYTSQRHREEEFYWCVWMSVAHSQRRVKRALVARASLLHWYISSSGQDTHSLFLGMLSIQKIWIFFLEFTNSRRIFGTSFLSHFRSGGLQIRIKERKPV